MPVTRHGITDPLGGVIHLEPIAPSHAMSLQPLLEDPAISATTPFPYPYPADGARLYIDEAVALREARTKYVFAVCEPDGRAIGMSLLKDVDHRAGVGELGYWIGQPHWGGGRATAAGAATIDFAFDTLGLTSIRAVCLEENPASLRVLEKLGFARTGRVLQALPKWPEPRWNCTFLLGRAVGGRDRLSPPRL
jgi:RimJ/RimL family protein N-acetyltransferase